jgi:hypothetical protein
VESRVQSRALHLVGPTGYTSWERSWTNCWTRGCYLLLGRWVSVKHPRKIEEDRKNRLC